MRGDVQHLHRPGAPGEHCRPLRRVSRTEGARAHRDARARVRARLARELAKLGIRQLNERYFDTVRFEIPGGVQAVGQIVKAALASNINLGYRRDGTIHVALDETVDETDIKAIVAAFAAGVGKPAPIGSTVGDEGLARPKMGSLARTSPFLTHPVFNKHHSETEMMRYIRQLERKDIGLDTSMIPLGSCTMKLNAASEMLPITWPEFSRLHPFAPVDQAEGYLAGVQRARVDAVRRSPASPRSRCSRTPVRRASSPA